MKKMIVLINIIYFLKGQSKLMFSKDIIVTSNIVTKNVYDLIRTPTN